MILKALFFILPAYVANMAPVFASAWRMRFGDPIDTEYFGEHKTWRGFVSGYIAALIILYIQKALFIFYPSIANLALFDYSQVSIFLYAFIFGVGAITGDLVKSFFKRRMRIKPGAPWFPFDQLDFIIGVIVFMYPLNPISSYVVWTLLLVTPALHVLANIAGYNLGLKKVWW